MRFFFMSKNWKELRIAIILNEIMSKLKILYILHCMIIYSQNIILIYFYTIFKIIIIREVILHNVIYDYFSISYSSILSSFITFCAVFYPVRAITCIKKVTIIIMTITMILMMIIAGNDHSKYSERYTIVIWMSRLLK